VNGQVNSNGFATNYWFEYGKDANLGNTNSIKSIDASASLSNVSEALSGLEPLTKYYFRLNAQNQFGTVNGATLSFTTSGPLNPGTPTVTTNQASNITSGGARLNGRINPNGAETTYWFEYSEDSLLASLIGSGTPTQTVNAGTNAVNVQASIDSLSKSTKYFYRLAARNQYGTVYGSIDSFTTKN
jgi:phosphodiesterase/alkaline phosphatase D-like protein